MAFKNFFLTRYCVYYLSEYPLSKHSILVSNLCRQEWKRADTFFMQIFSLRSLLQGTATLDLDLANFHMQAYYIMDYYFFVQ